MIISFFEGSAVTEPALGERIKKHLRLLIRKESKVTFYFAGESGFTSLCEWAVRELQAAFPKKCLESVGIYREETLGGPVPRVRYSRQEVLTGQTGADDLSVWVWMTDRSDYVLTYMDPLLCGSRSRLSAYQYAARRLGGRCVNLCSQEAAAQARALLPSLVRWERRALEGKLRGEHKKKVAGDLGVSLSTLHGYEIAAQHSIVKLMRVWQRPVRCCGILGFASLHMDSKLRADLVGTIRYLIQCCSVGRFLVSNSASSAVSPLMCLLRQLQIEQDGRFEINVMCPSGTPAKPPKYAQAFRYERRSSSIVKGRLEERNAIVDAADVILCAAVSRYRSGLSYAGRKHVPVINLADDEATQMDEHDLVEP